MDGLFRKNICCKRLSEEKNCMQHKWNRKKNSCTAASKKKDMVAKLFHHSRVALQNSIKTVTILPLLPLNSAFGDASECAYALLA